MNDPMKKSLDDLLADLPRDVPPPPYLWSGIAPPAAASSRRASRPMALAAAAGVAGACLASALTWAVLHGRSDGACVAGGGGGGAARRPSMSRATRAMWPRATLWKLSFRERLALLDPATRAKIEANLAIIRQAHEDIRKALASDPASPVLEQLWQSTWHDEIDLYEHVVQATQPTMTRI